MRIRVHKVVKVNVFLLACFVNYMRKYSIPKYDTQFFQLAIKNFRWHPIKIWLDFTGYPSNHFLGSRLNQGVDKTGKY